MGFKSTSFHVGFTPSRTALSKSTVNAKSAISKLAGTDNFYNPGESAFSKVKADALAVGNKIKGDEEKKTKTSFSDKLKSSLIKAPKKMFNYNVDSIKRLESGDMTGLLLGDGILKDISSYLNVDFTIPSEGNILTEGFDDSLRTSAVEKMYSSLSSKMTFPEVKIKVPNLKVK